MSAAHSPAPFKLHSRRPKGSDRGGHIILDAFGDSIAGLAWQTGDHSAAEQLANAQLFTASPLLLAAARLGRQAIADDLRLTVEGHTVPDAATLEPDFASLDEVAKPVVEELHLRLKAVDAAISAAAGGGAQPAEPGLGWFDRLVERLSRRVSRDDGLGGAL